MSWEPCSVSEFERVRKRAHGRDGDRLDWNDTLVNAVTAVFLWA